MATASEGPLLHAGASYHKRPRGEEENDDEELRRICSSYKRAKTDAASPFDLDFGDEDGFKLGDFAIAAMEPFDFGIKPAGPWLASPFAENAGLNGSGTRNLQSTAGPHGPSRVGRPVKSSGSRTGVDRNTWSGPDPSPNGIGLTGCQDLWIICTVS